MGSLQSDALDNVAAGAAGAGNPVNPLDPEEFRRQGHMVIDFLADYYHDVHKYPVRSQVEPGYLRKRLPETAPNGAEPLEAILGDITHDIIPGITHWMSPSYFAYFPSSGSTAGFLGEMLSTGINVVGFNWMSSPAATELENIVMDWLAKMLKLPSCFHFSGGGGGVLQGTTCEGILCALVAARDRALDRLGRDQIPRLVVYGSDQTHCSLQKAAQIAGIHPDNFRVVPTTRADAFALNPSALRAAIDKDIARGLVPLFLCATVGTTSSTAIDPVAGLCKVAKDYDHIWVHVDAAYAGAACICPEFRHAIDGVEMADSFSFNAHKWFLTNLDCCCMWVREPGALVRALSTNAEYLRNKGTESKKVVDYKDWQVALSRRFRSMKLWLVLRSYGVANLRNFLRGHVKMAKDFEGLVSADPRFEVVVPRTFAMLCFRLLSPPGLEAEGRTERANELNRRLLEAVNASGRAYVTHAVVGGVYMIRFAVGATLTEERHVAEAWRVVKEHATDLLASCRSSDSACPLVDRA
ncbi:hypothetical protein Taro_030474 [Colocasia esculenta]|uniref:Tyrosine decarboxylase n=1 Tax=Colocasia esculenta TaxID=4460 RepID=A0A843VU56_COLES|nr:hypothetical protein [Colocasia esculenta]